MTQRTYQKADAMKTLNILLRCLLALVLLSVVADAQTRKTGLTGAAFLKIGAGAREVALGTAVTGLQGEPDLMFYNPAGILQDQQLQASFNYNKWIADLKHNSAAVTYNLEDVGTIGVGFVMLSVSGIAADRDNFSDPVLAAQQTDMNSSSTYDYRDVAYQISFAHKVMERLTLGVTLKGISETIDGQSVGAFAVDFGSVYQVGIMDWTIAARFNNLGSDLKYYDIAFGLPLSFTIGSSIVPYKDANNRILLSVDALKAQDGPQYFYSGLEYTFMDLVSVRGGYKFNYSGTNDGGTTNRVAYDNNIEGLSLGGGFHTKVSGAWIGVDYAYTKMNLLSNVHRFSIKLGI
jgi:hypothetical protein